MFDDNRPKIKIQPTASDRILERCIWVVVLLSFIYPLVYYSQLPEQIPAHYNFSGEVNRYDHKSWIWIFPILNVIITYGMLWINKKPHWHNYPVKITEDNIEHIYKSSMTMLRYIALIIAFLMFLASYETVEISLNRNTQMRTLIYWLLNSCVIALIVLPILQIVKFFRNS